MKYMVVIEKGESGYGAFVPDLPGCIAAGETEDEVVALIREAIQFHLEDLNPKASPSPSLLPKASSSKSLSPPEFPLSDRTVGISEMVE